MDDDSASYDEGFEDEDDYQYDDEAVAAPVPAQPAVGKKDKKGKKKKEKKEKKKGKGSKRASAASIEPRMAAAPPDDGDLGDLGVYDDDGTDEDMAAYLRGVDGGNAYGDDDEDDEVAMVMGIGNADAYSSRPSTAMQRRPSDDHGDYRRDEGMSSDEGRDQAAAGPAKASKGKKGKKEKKGRDSKKSSPVDGNEVQRRPSSKGKKAKKDKKEKKGKKRKGSAVSAANDDDDDAASGGSAEALRREIEEMKQAMQSYEQEAPPDGAGAGGDYDDSYREDYEAMDGGGDGDRGNYDEKEATYPPRDPSGSAADDVPRDPDPHEQTYNDDYSQSRSGSEADDRGVDPPPQQEAREGGDDVDATPAPPPPRSPSAQSSTSSFSHVDDTPAAAQGAHPAVPPVQLPAQAGEAEGSSRGGGGGTQRDSARRTPRDSARSAARDATPQASARSAAGESAQQETPREAVASRGPTPRGYSAQQTATPRDSASAQPTATPREVTPRQPTPREPTPRELSARGTATPREDPEPAAHHPASAGSTPRSHGTPRAAAVVDEEEEVATDAGSAVEEERQAPMPPVEDVAATPRSDPPSRGQSPRGSGDADGEEEEERGHDDTALASRVRELELALQREQQRANQAESELARVQHHASPTAHDSTSPAPAPHRPQRPKSAPGGRPTAASAALVRRGEIQSAAPNTMHVFKGRGQPVPSRRERAGSIYYGSNIYYFGGRAGKRAMDLDANVYAFNPTMAMWKKIPTSGSRPVFGRHGHTCVAWHGNMPHSDPAAPSSSMVVFGGFQPALSANHAAVLLAQQQGGSPTRDKYLSAAGMAFARDLLCLDMTSKIWTAVAGDSLFDPAIWGDYTPPYDVAKVRGHTAVVYDRRMWIFGGIREGGLVSPHLDTIHLKRLKWVPLKKWPDYTPHGVYNHSAVVWGGSMWVYGGKNSDNDPLSWVYAYSFGTGDWVKKVTSGDKPLPRSAHSASVYRSSMIVYGGCTGFQTHGNDCYVLDLGGLVWSRVEMTTPSGVFGRQYASLQVVPLAGGDDLACGDAKDNASDHDEPVDGPLPCRAFVFGGGGDGDHHTSYMANQYTTNSDMLILDFCGGFAHAGKCENAPASPPADRQLIAPPRPVSVQLPMRFSRHEQWRVNSCFEPVAPIQKKKAEKKLTNEDIKQMSERLVEHTLQKRRTNLEILKNRLCKTQKSKRLTKEQEARAVDRMYTQYMNMKEQKKVALERRQVEREEKAKKTIEAYPLEQHLQRLYTEAMRKKEDQVRMVQQQFDKEREARPKLTRPERDRVNAMLYYTKLEEQKKKRNALLDKYISKQPEVKHRSVEEERATTERLFKGEAFVSP